ncbi:hypothetical protein ACOACO_02200 [Nocardioides sp. CPCC 205120]|uniref:hypothetical protein n=1 Tax=Nocardioides sp. CPCC 205120 TaxID=3406462 RepID=UPI003B50C431
MRTATALPTTILLIAALAACGGGGDEGDDTSPTGPASSGSSSSSAAPTPSATTSSATTDGFTADGSVLAVGTAATVALKPHREAPTGAAQVTVTEIEEVADRDVSADLGGDSAYVVRATLEVTAVADDFRGIQPSIDLNARVDGAVVNGASAEVADELGCGALDLRSSTAVGDTAEFCKVVIVEPGVVVDAAWTTYSDPTALSGDGYVLWVG